MSVITNIKAGDFVRIKIQATRGRKGENQVDISKPLQILEIFEDFVIVNIIYGNQDHKAQVPKEDIVDVSRTGSR